MLRRLRGWMSGRVSRFPPVAILAFAWVVAIAYGFPGYMNWDAGEQLYQSRTHHLEDWHPPIMGAYWHLLEAFVRGPFLMLVLQISLFQWGLYGILKMKLEPRRAAWVTAGLLLFPPILTPMAPVWKDAQMAAFLVAGTAFALQETWPKRAVGCVLLVLAVGVRDNAVAALPPICLLIASAWRVPGGARRWGAAFGGFVLIAALATAANQVTRDQRVFPWFKTVAIHDIAGSICVSEPMSDAEVREILEGVPLLVPSGLQQHMCAKYNPRIWFPLTFSDPNIFHKLPDKQDRLARRRAWFTLVTEHTGAFLHHRWNVMKEVLGLTASDPWEPVCQTFAGHPDHLTRISHNASLSWFQEVAGKAFLQVAKTPVYRPWVYVLISLGLLGYGFARRKMLVVALLGSGLLYEASLFIGAAAPDFRYSHWLVTCCCLSAALLLADRFRHGKAPVAPDPTAIP